MCHHYQIEGRIPPGSGSSSIPPERLPLKSQLLIALYSVRSDRVCE